MKKALLISVLLAGSATIGAGLTAIAQDAPPPPPPMGEGQGPEGPQGQGPHKKGPPPGMHGPMLEELDTNKDGNITKAEVQASKTARFAEIDTNKDGQLSAAEMTAHHDKKREEMRMKEEAKRFEGMKAKLDTNKDGKITKDEFISDDMPFFDKLDANKDGTITAEERASMKERFKDKKKDGKWKERRDRIARH